MAEQTEVTGIVLSDYGDQGFELTGDPESLRTLADALATADAIRLRADQGAGSIRVVRSGELLLMRHTKSEVTIAGKQQRLDDLGATIRFVASGPDRPSQIQFHTHVEWYEGHAWLDPESEPVVVSLLA
jgi:hypothetical protein